MTFDFDLFVIGGGSGGVRCARIAAGHGARVGIAEARFWGGTCVNVGCIPKKLMVQAGEYGAAAADAHAFGWRNAGSDASRAHDWPALIAAIDHEISRLNGVYVRMLAEAGVAMFEARAKFIDAHTLQVGDEVVTAERIVIATGGHPDRPPSIAGSELAILSDDAFTLPNRPARVLIVGGGYIGVEFAGIFQALGSHVDLVMRQPKPLRGFDEDLRDALADALHTRGVVTHPNCSAAAIAANPDGSRSVTLSGGTMIETDLVFFAVGRSPNTKGLDLHAAGVRTDDQARVVVDENAETTSAGIFALGDVSNRLNLTPVAIAEGHHLADRLFGPGAPRSWSLDRVAKAVFFTPPLASVGLTEAEAQARGPTDIYVTRFTPLRHTLSGRQAHRATMKLVVDRATDVVLGAHMLGDEAPEIIQGLSICVVAGLTKRDVDRTVGIHPTAAEEFVSMRSVTRQVG